MARFFFVTIMLIHFAVHVSAQTELKISIVDQKGVPIVGALVLVGPQLGVPFADNVLKSNSSGEIALTGEKSRLNWTDVPVTIEAPGFVRTTVYGVSFDQSRQGLSQIVLQHAHSPLKAELIGKTSGYGRTASNGTLDVSLVFPSVADAELGRLELTSLIGAGVDRVSVYGQELELPENLSVPQQTESFMGFIPVTLNKPQYRVRFPAAGDLGVSAVRAQFDFKKTVADLRDGKSFFDLINRFQFRSMATRYLTLKTGVQSYDLPIDEERLVPRIQVQGVGLPQGYAMIAIAAQGQGGRFAISDVKRLLNGERYNLVASEKGITRGDLMRLVRSLKKYQPSRTDFSGYDYEEVSTVVSHIDASAGQVAAPNVRFLEFLRPLATSGRSLHLDAPSGAVGGIAIARGRVMLSKVQPVSSGSLWLVEKTPLWEFRFPGVRPRIDIPAFGKDPWSEVGRYRWEHEYLGHDVAVSTSNLTHHVRTAVDFVVK